MKFIFLLAGRLETRTDVSPQLRPFGLLQNVPHYQRVSNVQKQQSIFTSRSRNTCAPLGLHRSSHPSQRPHYGLLRVDIAPFGPFLQLLLHRCPKISRLIQLSETTQRNGSPISPWSGGGSFWGRLMAVIASFCEPKLRFRPSAFCGLQLKCRESVLAA